MKKGSEEARDGKEWKERGQVESKEARKGKEWKKRRKVRNKGEGMEERKSSFCFVVLHTRVVVFRASFVLVFVLPFFPYFF